MTDTLTLSAAPGARPCGGRCGSAPPFEFTMAFQPVVDVRERRIYAYEALVRGPEGQGAGWVLAQVTEENRYAFDQACRVRAIELASRLGLDRRLNINFLPNAVYHPEACHLVGMGVHRFQGFFFARPQIERLCPDSEIDWDLVCG